MTQRLPVVLVHGVRLSGSMWEPTAALLRADRDVTCVDLPGHGTRQDEKFTIDGAVAVVSQAIDDLGGSALVAGMSLGGYVSMCAAARLGQPRVAGLVAMGCTADPRSRLRVAYEAFAQLQAKAPRLYGRMSSAVLNRMVPADTLDAFTAGGLANDAFADAVNAVATLDPIADVSSYDGPIWFINGARDQMRLNEKQFHAASARSRLTVWPGLNHLSIMADAQRLAREISDACCVVEVAGESPPTGE